MRPPILLAVAGLVIGLLTCLCNDLTLRVWLLISCAALAVLTWRVGRAALATTRNPFVPSWFLHSAFASGAIANGLMLAAELSRR